MTITASPAARSTPAVSAIWCPKFRESRTSRKRGSALAASTISSYVRSRLPSSTKIVSASPSSASMTPTEVGDELVDDALLVVCGYDERVGRHQARHGSRTRAPLLAKARPSRVTSVRSCSMAVAASKPSTTGSGRSAFRCPHRSATLKETGSNRVAKEAFNLCTQSSSTSACFRSRRCLSRSIPCRISPTTSTLRYSSLESTSANQAETAASRFGLRISEMTFVSRR